MGDDEQSFHLLDVGICDERSAASKKELEDTCEICKRQRPKYNCPGCYTRTCSLSCVQLHKVELGCDGIAKRTKMVTMEQFDALTLLSDYRFLEEAKRVASRTTGLLNGTTSGKRDFKRTKYLVSECRKRGMQLELSPWGMEKSRTNTSAYNPVAETIFWRIEWVFVDAGDYTVQTDKNPESVKLETLLRQFLKARHGCELLIPTFYDDSRFSKYHLSSNSDSLPWKCFLKCERNGWTKDIRYFKLDRSKSICDNMAGKIIVEFPTIYVTCSTSADAEDPRFPLLTEAGQLSLLEKRIWERKPAPRTVEDHFRLMTDLEKSIAKPVRQRGNGSKELIVNGPANDRNLSLESSEIQAKDAKQAASQANGRYDGKICPEERKSTTTVQTTTQAPMQPLRRLIRSQPTNSPYGHPGSHQSHRQHDDKSKKPPWNPFAAKRVGKRKAIEDLAVALSAEKETEEQKPSPKWEKKAEERRYEDVYVEEKSSGDKKDKKNDYFSLLGFHYASSDGDSDLEEGEIK